MQGDMNSSESSLRIQTLQEIKELLTLLCSVGKAPIPTLVV